MTRLAAIVAIAVASLGACSSGGAGSKPADASGAAGAEAPFELDAEPVRTTDVGAVKSYRFEPQVVAVHVGDEVTWTNDDDFPHNVHFLTGADETHDLPVGESVVVTFDEAGDFYYECSIHPQQMRGMVTVTG